MYIHEAIKARTADKPFIMRKMWEDVFGARRGVRLFPTCSPDGMIVDSRTAKSPRNAEDLVADDWIATA